MTEQAKTCCDRQAMGQVLETMLTIMSKSMQGVAVVAREHAKEMGLEFLGDLERPEACPVLKFHQDGQLRIEWNKVDEQLATIGKPTALYTMSKQMLLGLRGDKGDIAVRLVDIQQRRLDGVVQWMKEQAA